MPQNPPSKAHGFAMRSMSLCDMQISKSEKKILGPPPAKSWGRPWSTCSEVSSGVPQGTVLGPVLFLILMSDITEGINCNIVSFADDTWIYSAINSVTDCDDLQADLENIYKWADTNNMKFNSKKFQYINFGIYPEEG